MTQRIQNVIDVFLDALNNGTLVKGDPCGCAVGNLLANSKGIKLTSKEYSNGIKIEPDHNGDWYDDGCRLLREEAKLTEFTLEELLKIEKTFENNTEILHNMYSLHKKDEVRKDQINGLNAVIKVMLEFDEQKDDIKEVFTNKAELIAV